MNLNKRSFLKRISMIGVPTFLTGCVTLDMKKGTLEINPGLTLDRVFNPENNSLVEKEIVKPIDNNVYHLRFIQKNLPEKFEFKPNDIATSKYVKSVFDTIKAEKYIPYRLNLPTEENIDTIINNLQKEKDKLVDKKDLTVQELYDLNSKLVYVLRAYVDLKDIVLDKDKPINLLDKGNVSYQKDGTLMVRPGHLVQIVQNGYCLEQQKPAPMSGSPVYLDKYDKRIPAELRDIYDSLKKVNKNKKKKYNQNQMKNMFWAITEAGKPKSKFEKLTLQDFKNINEIHPGAGERLLKYNKDKLSEYQPKVEKPINNNPLINYQEPKEGLFVKTESIGELKSRITVVNTTNEDIPFDLTDYTIENTSKKEQAVSITSIESNDIFDEQKYGLYPILDEYTLLGKIKAKLDESIADIIRFLNNFVLKNISQNPAFVKLAVKSLGPVTGRFILEQMPILGSGISLYEAIGGKSWVDGRDLNGFERMAALLGVVPGAKLFTNVIGQKAYTVAQLAFTGAGFASNSEITSKDIKDYINEYANIDLRTPEELSYRDLIKENMTLMMEDDLSTPTEKEYLRQGITKLAAL